MDQILLTLGALTLGGSAAVAALALAGRSTRRRYGARWRCLAWLLLAPKEQPPRRVYLLGGQVSAEYGGIALPVENQALARDIRRLVNSLRYDDLQDLYPSLGQWPDR